MKLGFIGCGNMTQSIVTALVNTRTKPANEIYVTNRTPTKAKKLAETLGVNFVENNEDIVDNCDMVVLAVKPQDLEAAVEPIATAFHGSQTVVSLAAGYSISAIRKMISAPVNVIRVMPNTALQVSEGVIGYSLLKPDLVLERAVERLFSPMGLVVKLDEGDTFQALTVGAASGTGFVFELMIYWQEWLEEHGIESDMAREITLKTFLGAAKLADQSPLSFEELQSKVTSKKGVTFAGLDSMRELEVERLLRYSFEKAVIRDKELSSK